MKIKNIITICISILLLTIVSCNSNKDKAKKTVNNFFINLNGNKNSVTIDKIFTEDYEKFISKNYSFVSRDWILNDISENDSVIIIEYKSKGENSLGAIDMIQTFYLKKVKGEFLIFDSENVVTNSMSFEVIGLNQKSLTDMQKNMIFENITKNISIKILEKGRKSIFFNTVRGFIKITNNSNYDVKNVKVLIEHFDKQGKSVNTDYLYISDIIRKDGYRESHWSTNNCYKCEKQKFNIEFVNK